MTWLPTSMAWDSMSYTCCLSSLAEMIQFASIVGVSAVRRPIAKLRTHGICVTERAGARADNEDISKNVFNFFLDAGRLLYCRFSQWHSYSRSSIFLNSQTLGYDVTCPFLKVKEFSAQKLYIEFTSPIPFTSQGLHGISALFQL